MTVSIETVSSGPYTANGSQTDFPYTFAARSGDEVQVFVNDVEQSSALYTVALNSNYQGGTVSFDAAPSAGASVFILSNPDFTQQVGFQNAGAFLPQSHDEANDRAVIRDQRLKYDIGLANDRIDATEIGIDAETEGRLASVAALEIEIAAETEGRLAAIIAEAEGRLAGDAALLAAIGDLSAQGQFLKPEWFGAEGDGVTNDHDAFVAMVAVGTATGYLHIDLKPGATYLIGKQTAGAGTFYRLDVQPLSVSNASSFILRGNGATLKTNPGMLYGAFDTVTGLRWPDQATGDVPNINKARIPSMVQAIDCEFVHIENLIADGNSGTHIIGGYTSPLDQGAFTEGGHTGIFIQRAKKCVVSNVHATRFLQDGFAVKNLTSETSAVRPHTFINCSADLIGRNCLFQNGGNLVTYINCRFTNPAAAPVVSGGGYSAGLVFGTSPLSCCDVEGTPADGSYNRRIRFYNCNFEQGVNGTSAIVTNATHSGGIVSTKGITFDSCTIVGNLYLIGHRIRIVRSGVYGYFRATPSAAAVPTFSTLDNYMLIEDSLLTDATTGETTPLQTNSGGSNGYFSNPTAGTIIRNCQIDVTRHTVNANDFIQDNVTITYRTGNTYVAAGQSAVFLGAGEVNRLKIIDAMVTDVPATPVKVNTGTATVRDSEVVSAGGLIRWDSAALSTGFTGRYDNTDVRGLRGTQVLTGNAQTFLARRDKRILFLTGAVPGGGATLTLSTSGAVDGDRATVIRTAASTGGTYSVGGLKSLALGAGVADAVYSSALAAWTLVS